MPNSALKSKIHKLAIKPEADFNDLSKEELVERHRTLLRELGAAAIAIDQLADELEQMEFRLRLESAKSTTYKSRAHKAENELASAQNYFKDSMTGFYTKDAFNNRFKPMLDHKLEIYRTLPVEFRASLPIHVLFFVDMDDLKKINDTEGYAAGDEAIITFALRLKNVIRDSECIYRWGGDEFVIIMEVLPYKYDDITTVIPTRIKSAISLEDGTYDRALTASVGFGKVEDYGSVLEAIHKISEHMQSVKKQSKAEVQTVSDNVILH